MKSTIGVKNNLPQQLHQTLPSHFVLLLYKMITPELLNYIRQQLGAGVSKSDITNALKSQGWQDADINEALILNEHFLTENKNVSQPLQVVSSNKAKLTIPKLSSRKIIIISASILLVVAIGFGSFAYFRTTTVPSKTIQDQTMGTSAVQSTSTPSDQTAGWKTFVSLAGWSMKYPPDWHFESGIGMYTNPVNPDVYVEFMPLVASQLTELREENNPNNGWNDGWISISRETYSSSTVISTSTPASLNSLMDLYNPTDKSLDELFSGIIKEIQKYATTTLDIGMTLQYGKLTINGLPALRITFRQTASSNKDENETYYILVNPYLIGVSYSQGTQEGFLGTGQPIKPGGVRLEDSKNYTLFKNMLSTFKAVGPQPSDQNNIYIGVNKASYTQADSVKITVKNNGKQAISYYNLSDPHRYPKQSEFVTTQQFWFFEKMDDKNNWNLMIPCSWQDDIVTMSNDEILQPGSSLNGSFEVSNIKDCFYQRIWEAKYLKGSYRVVFISDGNIYYSEPFELK